MEAPWATTGPAKNLIEFACRAASDPDPTLRANITIATFNRSHRISNDFFFACKKAGLEAHVVQERFLFDLAVVPALRNLIDICQPDIIQSHAVKSHFLVRMSGLHRKCYWIAFQHGYTWTTPKNKIYNQLDRWSLPAASTVVAVCRPFAVALQKIGVQQERIVIQHNSVKPFQPAPIDVVSELRRSLCLTEETFVGLCIGRLSNEKAQVDLIEAAAILKRENSQLKVRIILAGDGPDRQILVRTAKSLQVDDWVHFAGHIHDLKPYYTLANFFVLPSHTEGSPNVLLEAMAAGLPIVATSVGGVPEIATNEKEALLVEKQNPVALSAAIKRLLSDGSLRSTLSTAARQRIGAFSPEAYCYSILSLYKNCMAGAADSWKPMETMVDRSSGRGIS
jgi:glycosyltransferase involved in cell wall biosynthesis